MTKVSSITDIVFEHGRNFAGLGNKDDQYALLIQQLPIAVYACDTAGRIVFFNDEAAILWGRKPTIGVDLWCGSWQIYNTDGVLIPHDSCPMASALRGGRSIRGVEIVVKRADGTLRNILPHATPIFDDDGFLTGAFNVLLDTTEEKVARLEKDLIAHINRIFDSESNLKECMHAVLGEICLLTDKTMAEAWITNPDNSELKLFASFTMGKPLHYPDGFVEILGKGESLPGRAFAKAASVFIEDMEKSKDEALRMMGRSNDLKSALAIPIISRKEVIAVLNFYSEETESNKITFREPGGDILIQLAVHIQRKKKEEELNHFFQLSTDMLCHLGPHGFFTKVNPAFCKAVGYSEAELCSKPYTAFLHPEDVLKSQEAELSAYKGRPGEIIENRYITKTGETKWLAWLPAPLLSGGLAFGVAKDITDRKNAEIQLAAYNNRISVILESITDGFCAVDKDWIVTYWNKEAERLLSMPRDRIIGRNLWRVYNDAIPLKFYTEYHRAMKENVAVHFQEYFPSVGIWLDVTGYPSEIGLSIYFKDVTDRMNNFEKLEKSEAATRNFAKRLTSAIEDERSRIAHEIHDELGQQLAGIKMSLSAFKKQVPGNGVLEDMVNTMVLDIDSTIKSLRKFATELRLGILESLGLVASIHWLAKEFEAKTKIKCHFDIDVQDQFRGKELSTCFFRICQEALTNVIKHAGATEVFIQMSQAGSEVSLKITDNGKGIVSSKLEDPFSMGLLGMRQRANLVGASLTVTSQPGVGTTVHLTAMIDTHEANSDSR